MVNYSMVSDEKHEHKTEKYRVYYFKNIKSKINNVSYEIYLNPQDENITIMESEEYFDKFRKVEENENKKF